MAFDQVKYAQQYRKANYRRLQVDLQPERYEEMNELRMEQGLSWPELLKRMFEAYANEK
jgi:hypothetical protein